MDIAISVLIECPEYWTKTQSSDEKVLFDTTDYSVPYGSKILNELKGDFRFSQQISALQQICNSGFDSVPNADNYCSVKIGVANSGVSSPKKVEVFYKGNYKVVEGKSTKEIGSCEGEVVEIVGQITQVVKKITRGYGNRPYCFLNFVSWKRNLESFRIVLWGEHLDQLKKAGVSDVEKRYINQYVSIVGMIGSYKGGKSLTFQLVPSTISKLKIIDKDEADFRLGRKKRVVNQVFGGTVPVHGSSIKPTGSNVGSNIEKLKALIDSMSGKKMPSSPKPSVPVGSMRPVIRRPVAAPLPVARPIGAPQNSSTANAMPSSNVGKLNGLNIPAVNSPTPHPQKNSGNTNASSPSADDGGCFCWFVLVIIVVIVVILINCGG